MVVPKGAELLWQDQIQRHGVNLTFEEFLLNQTNFTIFYTPVPELSEEVSCEEPSKEQMQFYFFVAWWLEGVIQIVLGCLGFIANSMAIPILLSKEMSSIFNRLLTCLAVFDNIFIVCSVLEAFRKHIGSTQLHEYVFGYFLYQFHNMILCSCIYITVVLALERYRAVWRPVEYHNNVNGINPWRRVMGYILPVMVFAVIFNLPKFFEAKFVERTMYREYFDDVQEEMVEVNYTTTLMAPTALRLNVNYVLWYSNVARLLVTGIFPFGALTYLNFRIYTVIKRRRRMTNRPRGAPSAAQKAEEARQAIVLLVIVVLFLICHTLRIILNIHGLFSLKIVRESLKNGCSGVVQTWTLIGTSISHIMLTINSSVNFIIYCFMCTTFRRIFYQWINKLMGFSVLPDVQHSEASIVVEGQSNVRELVPTLVPENELNTHTQLSNNPDLEPNGGNMEMRSWKDKTNGVLMHLLKIRAQDESKVTSDV
ncbi:hypothetical protein TCAL_05231 [Tigriopus californicus]|uniref:G-protein coupled receptors family 1 profile domain-containing protein n=1 Tax=Tigriopus californicus TaxID=6832 RepID=A0A553NVY3_TIGCA|nr:FMRFamide receptor-like [Tigriopus californicus]XP_059088310.1 FMRFamide receptor-like [Tigriopus californicus]TRY69587.1 hypothetical protein TCAL_05231 [Tigriopus californicus]|eukprot:TCALIF_05231-PA protein Name:"Similar to FR FMRFamide receptor (Drosophila melanogaster)" AED:0.06 eAED:0.06 QI:0/1/0/1/1/1/3/0/480